MNLKKQIITLLTLTMASLYTKAQDSLVIYLSEPSNLIKVNPKTIDSITAYVGLMVTDVIYDNKGIQSIEFFNCGKYLTAKGKSLDSLNRAIHKRKKKRENIETLLKKAYTREVFSLEQKHCISSILGAYFGMDRVGTSSNNENLTSISYNDGSGIKEIAGKELQELLRSAKEKNGYDILPYFIKYNRDEERLLLKWRKYD